MSLHYIIDGYNLIKHRFFASRAISQRAMVTHPNAEADIHDGHFALIQFLRMEKPCGSFKNKVTIIFDGYSGGLNLRDLEFEVIFSCESSADERIKEIVETNPLPKSLVVVSDDRQIRDFVKSCGAVSLGIEEFLTGSRKKTSSTNDDSSKPQLNYSAARKINEELRKLWLK